MNQSINDNQYSNLRILFIGPYPPPFGGISSLIKSLVEGLKEKNIDDAFVLYFGNTNSIKKVEGATLYVRSVKKNVWRAFNPINLRLVPSLLRAYSGYNLSLKDYLEIFVKTILTDNIVKEHKINTTNFYQSDYSLHLLLCKELWKSKVSVVLQVFGELYDLSPQYVASKKGIFFEMLHVSDAIISSSCHCAESFKIIGNKREINVIFIGVSISRFSDNNSLRSPYRNKLGVKEEEIVLLFMGRFNKEMGLHAIIEMIPFLMDSKINFHVVLAGAVGELVKNALECQLQYPENITVMNDIPFDLQPSLYAASDIVLAPSRDKHACMGVTIKEAMAASLPVIASDSGGIPEAIIHEETGIIVPLKQDGENDTKNYIEAILSLSEDVSKRRLFAKNSRKRASEIFSEEETLTKTIDIFNSYAPKE
ncbi:glycosyltransferase family 4 protein [SAR86 cluster bacterium]|nr:glycosyltransferase family 4 protein [SAR86 cluster bacterium]